mgnify:CR=1 FL=1
MHKLLLTGTVFLFMLYSASAQVLIPEGKKADYRYTDRIPDYIFIDDDRIPLYNDAGIVNVHKDPRLDFLVEKYNENKTYTGYRIQIYSGKEREAANKIREEFLKTRPEVAAHLIYQQPNFKLRVGDFTNRLEALRFFENIKGSFPSAFVIKDEIKINK